MMKFFRKPLSYCDPEKETEEEFPPLPEVEQKKKPINQTKRIVVIGDGEDAALTAFLIARDPTVNHYNYSVHLIQGGKGVRPDSQEVQDIKPKKFMFGQRFNFAMNFLFVDFSRSSIFERHFYSYLKNKMTYSQSSKVLKQLISTDHIRDFAVPEISIGDNQLKIKVEGDDTVPMILLMSNLVTTYQGQVRFIHPFGFYIGHCEVEDSPQLKSMKGDYYVLCNTYFLPFMMRYIKQKLPLLRTTTQIYSDSFGLETKNLQLLNGLWTFLTPDNLPIIGRSTKFKNLFYNLGNTDTDLNSHIRNANFIRDQIARDILYINEQSVESIADPIEVQGLKPARFLM